MEGWDGGLEWRAGMEGWDGGLGWRALIEGWDGGLGWKGGMEGWDGWPIPVRYSRIQETPAIWREGENSELLCIVDIYSM